MSVHLNELSSVYLDQIVEKKCKDDEKESKDTNKKPRWWDDDGDGIGYEPGEVDGKFPNKDKDKKKSKKKSVDEAKKASLKQARKNIGMDPNKPSCWTGYKAKGTKMKNGRSVPNCVKASHEPEGDLVDEAKKSKMKKARENVGASTCWDGYVAKGTKKKNGRDVPNCVPEGYSDWRSELTETLGEGILIEVEKKKSLKNNSEKITDGPVDNSSIIKINPDFKEGIEYLGGTIVEFTEVSEEKDKNPLTPQQRLNRDAGKIAAKKVKQRDHAKYVNFLPYDEHEEVQWVANTAAEYFVEEGLNEDGIEILIEELGLESFVEYVYELSEEVLTEARAGGVRVEPVTKTGKSVGSLKGGARSSAIKRLRKEKQARRDSESGSSKPSGMTAALKSQSDRVKAVDTAKKQQPKKRGLLDRVGDAVVKGIERHNKAMATAKKLSNETGKTLKKAGKVAGAVAKGAGEGVKMAGNAAKVAHKVATEQVEVDEATAMAKRGYDEAPIRKKIAANTSGGKSADRATALASAETYGRKGTDPKARQRLAQRQRTDFRNTTSSSPGLHGYGHQSNDPAVKAKQAARGAQRGVLTPNEKKSLNREAVVYGGTPAKEEKPKMLVTRADKLGGTRAYKNMTAGDKRYKAADHLTSQVETGEDDMRLRLKERLKAAYEVTSPYIVDEGYRVVSKSYKHGDGKPEDDVTIKREKKVVSGDNLTRKGANQSKERRGREYGNQDAFAVQKTREAKKRSSNAPSADKVKADINKKEKQREKTSYNRKIGGMNRAGTASGKVAAARLKGMKKIDAMEEVAIENVQGGPILPGEKGKKVYPKKDQPKKTGAKLPKINPIDERTRYAKETGKDFKTGNSSERGGTRTGKSAFDKVSSELRKTGGLISSRGNAIPPQGKKKVKGEKGREGVTPVDKIKGKLSKQRAPKPQIGSRFD